MSIYHHPWFMFSHLCGILEYPYLAVWWFYAAFGKRGKNKSFVATIFRVETNDLGWHIPTKWRQIFTIGPFQPACTCTLLNLQKKEKKQQKKILVWKLNSSSNPCKTHSRRSRAGGWRPQYQLSIRSPRWWLMTSIRRSAIVAPTSYVTARLVIKARFNPATWTRERGMFFFLVPLKMVLLLANI